MAKPGDKDQTAEFEELDQEIEDINQSEANEVLEEEQLTLADDEERLPWLESDDDEDDEGGVNTGFLATVALIGLLMIVLVLGLIWWFGRDENGDGPPADGSTIAAPQDPYKTRPDDPGGTQVSGTGDMSFAQGEGETRESQIASDPAPAPGFSDAEDDGDDGDGVSDTSGVGVQVGAYSNREQAQAGWNTLRQRFDALEGVNRRILEAQVDGATVYRLQAVASDAEAARTLCNAIKAGGGDCQVKN